jgi:hypothetical protein
MAQTYARQDGRIRAIGSIHVDGRDVAVRYASIIRWRTMNGHGGAAMKTMKVYGGFVSGKLHLVKVDDGFGLSNWRRMPALFKRREEARVQYEDVRPVEVRWGDRKGAKKDARK